MDRRYLVSVADLNAKEIFSLILRAKELKDNKSETLLTKKTLALLFEKPSLRTKVSFDVAMYQLGGHTIYLSDNEVGLGKREPVSDIAAVLSRYVDIIAAGTFLHSSIQLLAQYSTVPVINALSDMEHPCQALSDLFTIYEKKGNFKGLTLAYVGDGNNVSHSILLASAIVGMNICLASPAEYMVNKSILEVARKYAKISGASILLTEEAGSAVKGADIVYTDVWTSMGQEAETEKRRYDFKAFQLNKLLLDKASKEAIIMHPLPAHYGDEVEAGILDSDQSVIYDQAENRLHMQKAVILFLLGK